MSEVTGIQLTFTVTLTFSPDSAQYADVQNPRAELTMDRLIAICTGDIVDGVKDPDYAETGVDVVCEAATMDGITR